MGAPKALTPIAGEAAIARITRVARACGLDVTVVTRVGIELPPLDARIVMNPTPEAGRTGSLQLGLAVVKAREVLCWPVDHPLASEATARALLATPGDWVVPEHAGRGGHPILLRGIALDAVRSAPPSAPLRDLASAVGIVPVRVPIGDAGVLANLDSPDDLRKWLR